VQEFIVQMKGLTFVLDGPALCASLVGFATTLLPRVSKKADQF
jgi:hypothetical protein